MSYLSVNIRAILLLFSFFTAYKLFPQIEDETRLEKFVRNFYSKPDYVENQNFISAEYGLSFISIPISLFDKRFMNTFQLNFKYGYYREDLRTRIPFMFRHQGEFAFLSNISTNFKTFKIKPSGVITDTWRWGFGLNDGYGYFTGKNSKLLLNHSVAFVWSHIDFDISNYNLKEQKLVNLVDENFKFGEIYSGGIDFTLFENISMNFNYENTIVYPDLDYLKFTGMWLFDNLVQRTPDIFEDDFIELFGANWGWIKFLYKNSVSLIFWNLRREQSYFPIESNESINFDSYKIGLKYIFD